jgi:hypothetical protein
MAKREAGIADSPSGRRAVLNVTLGTATFVSLVNCCESPALTSRLVLAVQRCLHHVDWPGMIRTTAGLSPA